MADVASMSFLAIARKYGVSDNAVRKWIRWHEYERAHPGADELMPGEETGTDRLLPDEEAAQLTSGDR